MLAKPPDPGSWNPQSDGATDVRKEFRQIRRITTVRNAPEWRTLEHSRTFAQILSQSLPAATLRRQPLFCFSFPPKINFAANMWNHTRCTFCGWLLFTQHSASGFIPVAMDVSCSFRLIAEQCAFVRTGRLCLPTLLLRFWAISPVWGYPEEIVKYLLFIITENKMS